MDETISALTTSLGNERSSLHDLEQVAAADLHSLRPDHERGHAETGIEDDSIRTIDPDFHDNHNGLDISVSFDMSGAAPGFDSADTIVPAATPGQAVGRPSNKGHTQSSGAAQRKLAGVDEPENDSGLLGYGYRGSAYSNLAELRALLEQKTEDLRQELDDDFALQRDKITRKLDSDLHSLRDELEGKHEALCESLIHEEAQRTRHENAAALEDISLQFQQTKDRITREAKRMYDEKSEQAEQINAKLRAEKELAIEKMEFAHRLQVQELTADHDTDRESIEKSIQSRGSDVVKERTAEISRRLQAKVDAVYEECKQSIENALSDACRDVAVAKHRQFEEDMATLEAAQQKESETQLQARLDFEQRLESIKKDRHQTLVRLKQEHRQEIEALLKGQDEAMQTFWSDVERVFVDLQTSMAGQNGEASETLGHEIVATREEKPELGGVASPLHMSALRSSSSS